MNSSPLLLMDIKKERAILDSGAQAGTDCKQVSEIIGKVTERVLLNCDSQVTSIGAEELQRGRSNRAGARDAG